MALKKINIELYYKDQNDLMQQLYKIHNKASEGFYFFYAEKFDFHVWNVEEIPYTIEFIDGNQCMVYQSKMNKTPKKI
tara:strand:- start:667 stop:900 length:234 start_codon:yes stop_codon:yes gene_type:complete